MLLKVHTGILGELEMLLDKWPAIEAVGAVFLKKVQMFHQFIKCIVVYFAVTIGARAERLR